MRRLIGKDLRWRKKFFNKELKGLVKKFLLFRSQNLSFRIFSSNFFPKEEIFPLMKIKNRCIWTGRSRGLFRFFRGSRHIIKNFVSRKKIRGFIKKSW